jgi:hypothetical protein
MATNSPPTTWCQPSAVRAAAADSAGPIAPPPGVANGRPRLSAQVTLRRRITRSAGMAERGGVRAIFRRYQGVCFSPLLTRQRRAACSKGVSQNGGSKGMDPSPLNGIEWQTGVVWIPVNEWGEVEMYETRTVFGWSFAKKTLCLTARLNVSNDPHARAKRRLPQCTSAYCNPPMPFV